MAEEEIASLLEVVEAGEEVCSISVFVKSIKHFTPSSNMLCRCSSVTISGGGYRDDRPPYRGDRGGGPAYDNRGGAPYYRDDRYDNYSSGPSRGGDRDSRGGGYDNYR